VKDKAPKQRFHMYGSSFCCFNAILDITILFVYVLAV